MKSAKIKPRIKPKNMIPIRSNNWILGRIGWWVIKDAAVKYFNTDGKDYLVAYYVSNEDLDSNYIRKQ